MSRRNRIKRETNLHHRLPRKAGGLSDEENISEVPVVKHEAYNTLFNDGHMPPEKIARQLTDIWIRPDYRMVAFKKPHNCVNCGRCTFNCAEAKNEATTM